MTPTTPETLVAAQQVVTLATTRAILGRESGMWHAGIGDEIAELLARPGVAELAVALLEATAGHCRAEIVTHTAWLQGCDLALSAARARTTYTQVTDLAAIEAAAKAAIDDLDDAAAFPVPTYRDADGNVVYFPPGHDDDIDF